MLFSLLYPLIHRRPKHFAVKKWIKKSDTAWRFGTEYLYRKKHKWFFHLPCICVTPLACWIHPRAKLVTLQASTSLSYIKTVLHPNIKSYLAGGIIPVQNIISAHLPFPCNFLHLYIKSRGYSTNSPVYGTTLLSNVTWVIQSYTLYDWKLTICML